MRKFVEFMKILLAVILALMNTFVSIYAQTLITLQKDITNNLLIYEFESIDKSKIYKRAGERWRLLKSDNKLTISGSDLKNKITEVSFLDGTTFYSIDNQVWHKKSYILNEQYIENRKLNLFAQLNEITNSIEIECTSHIEGNAKFYLMPIIGTNRIFLGSSGLYLGINRIQFYLHSIKPGSYFLIMDQNINTSIYRIIIL